MQWFDQGGSAFPIPHSNEPGAYEAETGMSLRDWFASQAMGAIIEKMEGQADSPQQAGDFVAALSYVVADAMLLARQGGAS